jgi:protein phosphatase
MSSSIALPDFCLVVLIGATGAGKSTFARKHFHPTEIVSSDVFRGLIIDDENDQSINLDTFELVAALVDKRLKHRRLTVVDATNVRAPDRKRWVELARQRHAELIAIILDVDLETSLRHNAARPDRQFSKDIPAAMIHAVRQGIPGLAKEGYKSVWHLRGAQESAAAKFTRAPLLVDKRSLSGPFDIIGDIHGCADELELLLARLGYRVRWTPRLDIQRDHQRTVVFVGDLVDRGPRTPDVVRIARWMIEGGMALAVRGNHEDKAARWLEGRAVKPTHGLQATIDQYEALWREGDPGSDDRNSVRAFFDSLPSHLWLDGGRLCVAHAGIKADMIGRESPAVRKFTLYGQTTGETDERGLPVRADWAADYRGSSCVVYGHTPIEEAVFVNNTICLDTACVFGGKLTALRWPERELLSVAAARKYF